MYLYSVRMCPENDFDYDQRASVTEAKYAYVCVCVCLCERIAKTSVVPSQH